VKGLLVCVLVIGLAAAGPNPLSVCALFSSIAGDCTSSVETQSPCDKMDMGEHTAQSIMTRSASCCVVSQAPLPESKNEVSKTSVKLEKAATLVLANEEVNSASFRLRSQSQELSPPPLRSLLCTFLI